MEEKEEKTENRKNNTTLAGQQVVIRFYIAVQELINTNTIRGIQTFTKKYNIDRRAFLRIAENPRMKAFDCGWLSYLVKDFNVNSEWLLTGKGSMFKEDSTTVKKA